MSSGKTCRVCGRTQSEGPWTYYVRPCCPYVVSVCSECNRKHIALFNATWKAWPKKWLWIAIVLWGVSMGLFFGNERLAAVLPIRVRDVGVAASNESNWVRERNELDKQAIVIGLGALSSVCALLLFWRTYLRARHKASDRLSTQS